MSVRTSLAIRRGAQIFGPPRTPVLQAAVEYFDTLYTYLLVIHEDDYVLHLSRIQDIDTPYQQQG